MSKYAPVKKLDDSFFQSTGISEERAQEGINRIKSFWSDSHNPHLYEEEDSPQSERNPSLNMSNNESKMIPGSSAQNERSHLTPNVIVTKTSDQFAFTYPLFEYLDSNDIADVTTMYISYIEAYPSSKLRAIFQEALDYVDSEILRAALYELHRTTDEEETIETDVKWRWIIKGAVMQSKSLAAKEMLEVRSTIVNVVQTFSTVLESHESTHKTLSQNTLQLQQAIEGGIGQLQKETSYLAQLITRIKGVLTPNPPKVMSAPVSAPITRIKSYDFYFGSAKLTASVNNGAIQVVGSPNQEKVEEIKRCVHIVKMIPDRELYVVEGKDFKKLITRMPAREIEHSGQLVAWIKQG